MGKTGPSGRESGKNNLPHPEEPNQLSLDYEIIDNTDNAVSDPIKEKHEFIDPRGAYVHTAEIRVEKDSSGQSRTLFKVENAGVDLRIVTHEIGASQGAEDGRAWAILGWSQENGVLTNEQFTPAMGVGAIAGRGRQTEVYTFPEDARPLFEFKDEFYVFIGADSDTTDTFKTRWTAYMVPDHEASERTLS